MNRTRLLTSLLIVFYWFLSACAQAPEVTQGPSPAVFPMITETPESLRVQLAQKPLPAAEQPAVTKHLTSTSDPALELSNSIVIWHAWDESEVDSLLEVIDGFKELHPYVQFVVSYFPFDGLQGRYRDAVVKGDGPTLLIGPAEWGPALFDGNVIADLSQLADQELQASINEAALAQLEYKRALIGLPEAFRRGVVMFRNKDIIPDSPRTLDELIEMATQANQGDVIGADFDNGFYFSGAQLTACGGKLMDERGNPAFNNAAGVCWLNLLRSFKDSGLLVEFNTDNDANLFKAGRLGFLIDGSENITNLAEAIGVENLAIDPWPVTERGHLSGFVETEAIYLNPTVETETRQVAWAFMEYFLSPEAQAILTDPTKAAHLPTVKDVKIQDRLMKETVMAFERSTPLPVIPEMNAYWGSMEATIQSIFVEDVDPISAIQQAYNKIITDIDAIRAGGN